MSAPDAISSAKWTPYPRPMSAGPSQRVGGRSVLTPPTLRPCRHSGSDCRDEVRDPAADPGDVGRPRGAVRPARWLDRARLLVHVLPQDRSGLGERRSRGDEQGAAVLAGRRGRRPGAGGLRRRGAGRLGEPGSAGGLPEAQTVVGDEAGRRRRGLVSGVLLRRQAVAGPGPPASPARRGSRPRTRPRRADRRVLPRRQGGAQPRRLHVLRVAGSLREGRLPRGRTPLPFAGGDAPGAATEPSSGPSGRRSRR